MDCDYTKRSYLLPAGCKDLIDVLKLKQKQKFAPYLSAKLPKYWKKVKPGKQPAPLPQAKGQIPAPTMASWKDLFDTYWRLIYGVAIKAGLNDAEAQEVVQETIIAVGKKMEGFKYDPKIGSFKGWLLHTTQWRISDKMPKRHDNDAK